MAYCLLIDSGNGRRDENGDDTMTTTTTQADFDAADALVDALIAVECDASQDPDMRIVMRDERMGVMSLAQRHRRPGASQRDLPSLRERIDEAVRVAGNWGVDISHLSPESDD